MVLADDAGARLSNDELTALVSNANQLSDPHRQPHRWRNDPGGFCRISDHKKCGNVIGMSGEAVLAYKALLSDLG
jgi:hypothetical protein